MTSMSVVSNAHDSVKKTTTTVTAKKNNIALWWYIYGGIYTFSHSKNPHLPTFSKYGLKISQKL